MHKGLKIAKQILNMSLVLGFLVLFGFAKADYRNEACIDVKTKIDKKDGNQFLDSNDVVKVLYEIEPTGLVGVKRQDIALDKIESQLLKDDFIESAEVYMDHQANLIVHIEERHPLLRIINSKGVSYYLDEHGKRMPFSAKFTSRVLIANGLITDDYPKNDTIKSQTVRDLFHLTETIRSFPELKDIVLQLHVNKDKEYAMVTLFGSHTVLVGDLSNLENKLKGLVAFYAASKDKVDLSKYREVNLKFKDQIVCKRF